MLAFCVANAGLPSAQAQPVSTIEDGVQSYPRAYFEQYHPQTALDMIDRLPGFTLDAGEDLRGFGAGAGNVLINGERPSSKTGGIEDALSRVPADAVTRIDLIRGSAGASETAGQAIVANVIRTTTSGSSRWEAQLKRAAHGRINAEAELSLSRSFGAWETSTELDAMINRQPLDGTRISRDAAGALSLIEFESRPGTVRRITISAEAKRDAAGGVLTLNGRFNPETFYTETERFGFDGGMLDGAPEARRFIIFDRSLIQAEFGADWSRPLANDWSVKLLSLSSFDNRDIEQGVFSERPVGAETSNSRSVTSQNSFETVLRAVAGRSGEGRLKPEFGAEFAYNRLDSALSLRVEDASGISNIALPAANVLVEELRGEIFANVIWKATNKLSVETGVGAELSEITVSGDADSTQSFFFVKPFATLIYDPRPGIQLRLGARRTVGQLDFRDFAASESAASNRVTAGNPELGPDQTTRLSFSTDLRSDTRGALNVEVFHEWRSDVLEHIVLPSGGQGTANAGSARVWGVKTNGSLPLSPVIPGGLIEVEAEFLDSTFADPITGERRVVSSIDSPNIFAQFRQDLIEHRVAWGFSYRAQTDSLFFFADEESFAGDGRRWAVFAETTRIPGVKTNLEFAGIGKQNFFRNRRFFDPDRSGIFTGSQNISRERGMQVTLTMSGRF